MPPSIDTVRRWQGRPMVDAAGDELGTIDAASLDDQTGQPGWATLTNGPLTAKAAFVPLAHAQDLGGRVRVPYDHQQVTDAPSMEAGGSLPQDQEAELYRHYGLDDPEPRPNSGLPSGERDRDDDGVYDDVQDSAVGRDTSGPATDQAMTRSEEELAVGTQARGRGRVRLRKYVVTETQQVTVPVQREEVRVGREPVTDANRDAATSGGPELSQDEHEVTLHEEAPVAERRVVPASGSASTPRRSARSARSPRRSARSSSRSTTRTSPAASTSASRTGEREGRLDCWAAFRPSNRFAGGVVTMQDENTDMSDGDPDRTRLGSAATSVSTPGSSS